jgi:hypothetical protein
MAQSPAPHPGVALGGVFLSLFGALWLAGASIRYLGTSPAALAAIAVGAAAIAAWGLALFRRRRPAYGADAAARKRLARAFMVVNAVQWSLIGFLILALNVTGHVAWIVPGVIFIVGVHFVPLARLFRYRGYDATAAALVLVAVLDFVAGAGDRAVAPSLLATGAILWISAIVLLRAMQPRRAAGGMPARAP